MAPKTARGVSPPKTNRGGKDGGGKADGGKASDSGKGGGKGNKTKRSSSAPKQRKGDGKEKSAEEEKAVKMAEEVAAVEVEEEANNVGKRRRPKPELMKQMTTGHVAVVDFVEEDEESGVAKPKASASQSAEGSGSGGDAKQSWQCERWLSEVVGLLGCIADALCVDGETHEKLEDEAALAHVRTLESKQDLLARLTAGGTLERLTDAIWPKLEVLRAGPATASELAAQWKEEGAGDLLYGGLPSFFQGLEPRIGSPDPKVFEFMERDHCSMDDSQVEFTTGNYSVVTTSEVEWKFVVQPETPLKWPIEERLMNSTRRAATCASSCPRRSSAGGWTSRTCGSRRWGGDTLVWFEVCGGRLYTGPLFVKYNGTLRGLDSPVPFLKNAFIQLTTSKDVFERFIGESKPWQPANGTLPYDKAKKEANLYTTTIHVINSFIVKMGKLTKAVPVYRGMSLRIFPEQFWKQNEQGVMGGVEFAFMSTTPDRSVAEQYSQDGFGIIVEMDQGMIDRGAEIAWLSQYPHEVEVLFAPLAGLQATEMRIDTHPLNGKHIIVVKMRVSINLTNPTIEQVVAKRRKICSDMGKGLLMEMRSALNKKGSHETDGYLA